MLIANLLPLPRLDARAEPHHPPAARALAPTAAVHASIREVPRERWEAMAPGSAFGWAFHAACENAAPQGFGLSHLTVSSGDALWAAVPVFRVPYRVDMSFGSRMQAVGNWIYRRAPRLVSVPMIGLGSPLSDACELRIAAGLDAGQRATAVRAVLDMIVKTARERKIDLIAIKDATPELDSWLQPHLAETGFSRLPSLPVATLDVPFRSLDEYFESLSASMRSDLRRKQRQSKDSVTLETVVSAAGLEAELSAMSEETHRHGAGDYGGFDTLSPGYVPRVLEAGEGTARLRLGRVNGRLASFSLFFVEPGRVVAQQIGMHYPLARDHNLYFLHWLDLVGFCIAERIPRLEFGQTSYAVKRRLGCRLEPRWAYVRHRIDAINRVVRWVVPRVSFGSSEPA